MPGVPGRAGVVASSAFELTPSQKPLSLTEDPRADRSGSLPRLAGCGELSSPEAITMGRWGAVEVLAASLAVGSASAMGVASPAAHRPSLPTANRGGTVVVK